MAAAISTTSLSKIYGRLRALDDLDLEIPTGSIFGVIGPNGAGKSTLMRILLDLARPTSGSAAVLGTSPSAGGAKLRQRIGYLPGELRLSPKWTGRQHLQFWASLAAEPRLAQQRGMDLAAGLDVRLDEATRNLSKGNKQKLGIAQAFMADPELVILDEPTSGLDPLVQQQVLRLVSEAQAGGATVLLSSHVMGEIEQVADAAAVLHHGRLVALAPMSELRASASRRVRALVRDPARQALAVLVAADLPLAVSETASGETAIVGDLDGRPGELVAALAKLDLVSLVVAEQDLGERVLGLYGTADADGKAE